MANCIGYQGHLNVACSFANQRGHGCVRLYGMGEALDHCIRVGLLLAIFSWVFVIFFICDRIVSTLVC